VFDPGTKEPDESQLASQTDLPAQLTPLVGREQELEEACALLRSEQTRLLTLTGPGGVGKTRLGIRVAEELADEFADGVSFDSLAPIREPELVIPTIARTLGLRELGERPLSERLGELLKDRDLLLLLDNFEQVVEAAPRVAELLAVCPSLKVLTTSREVLHLSCERVFPVPPLGLPDVDQLPEDIRAVSEYGAVAFFVQRARMAKPDFRLTEENGPVVAEICVRLDGMPLAIELAAARLKLISPRAILERLRRRLRLLKGGPRDAPVRQKTLRDAIGWSYDLLGAEERLFFGRLSVFAGGCTLEAAETVCDPREDLTEQVLDLLASLMDKSLLNRAETEDGESRFWMLETVKEYALERLEAAGEEQEIRRAHAANYLALAEEARPELKGPRQTEWFDRLESEHDNLRAALSWSLEGGDPEMALRLVANLWWFWYKRGHLSEGRRWLEEVLEKNVSPSSIRAEALNGAGVLARNQSDYDQAQAWLEESLVLRRELGDKAGTSMVLVDLGTVAGDRGHLAQAVAFFEKSLRLKKEVGDRWGTALVLGNLATAAYDQGKLADAAALSEESLELFRALGDKAGIAWAFETLGEVAEDEDQYGRAAAFYQESLALYREVEEKEGIAIMARHLGRIARIQRDYGRAAALYDESLFLYKELGGKLGIAHALEGMAALRAACGQPEPATRLWAAAEALREEISAPLENVERAKHEALIAAARETLGEAAFANAWSEGQKLTPEQALEAWREQEIVPEPEPIETPARLAGLTAGEAQVLRLVASGMTNVRVAEELFVSRRTVDAHLRSIYRKLGVASRTEATRYAIDRGLL
jgi:predicted ATPase/DNA-binding CsgD family transcriptional regulator